MDWNTFWTIFLPILPPTIAATAALIVAIKTQRENKKDLIVIHDLVNSNLSKVKTDLETALLEIKRLQRQ